MGGVKQILLVRCNKMPVFSASLFFTANGFKVSQLHQCLQYLHNFTTVVKLRLCSIQIIHKICFENLT